MGKIQNAAFECKKEELGILRNEAAERLRNQTHIFIFFYSLSSAILSYVIISGNFGLAFMIPGIISIGEIQIMFDKAAGIMLGNYIKDEIENKLNILLTNDKEGLGKEFRIWWESYLREKLTKHILLYNVYLCCRFLFYTTFFVATLFIGIIWLVEHHGVFISAIVFGFYSGLFLIVLLCHITIKNMRLEGSVKYRCGNFSVAN